MKIGKNTYISSKAKIIAMSEGFNTDNFEIGDNSYIGDYVQIICDNFKLGDYSKIHHHTNLHGKNISIGHNAWVGQYTIIDGLGNTKIKNNCGIGAHSQLWSHIKYGDTLEGCRFLSESELNIGNDVWLVGHCIVSPVRIEDKAMALAGSVITKNMEYNSIYAGSPAKNISEKIGKQFLDVTIEEKIVKMKNYLKEFGGSNKIIIVPDVSYIKDDENIYFAVKSREYTKKLTEEEINFMKFLLPNKAKFTPL
jgi:acetyltransferase-like isoleucine patch superfamily enzyme